ncbi:MAG: SpoVG family protein [Endomicrobia bacterium]|nr:SpoVG family protein [Endomicrobiia bacterium]MDW8056558.1 septation protein SpoVG family protein [Elusimicrobiota bacterium]
MKEQIPRYILLPQRKFIIMFVMFTLCSSLLYNQTTTKIYITDVQKTAENLYSITLNDLIIIKEIKVKKTKIGQREIVNIEFPTYISKRGKAYPQVTILDKNLNDKIIKVITSGKPETVSATTVQPKFKIGKYSPYRRSTSSLKVFASIIFDDVIEIECKIMHGRRGPWISWPSRKDETTGKWVKQVVFKSKEYQKQIEQELLNRYKVGVEEEVEE